MRRRLRLSAFVGACVMALALPSCVINFDDQNGPCATPTIDPPSGHFANRTFVTLACATAGAQIYYTADGTDPTSDNGTLYTEPFAIEGDVTVQAIATEPGWSDSPVASAQYTLSWKTLSQSPTGGHSFSSPGGIMVDSLGRIYVTQLHGIVRVNDMTGAGWTEFGTQGGGVNQFNAANGIAMDSSGRLYVTDGPFDAALPKRIVRINDMTGAGWTTYGAMGPGAGQFAYPLGIGIGPADGRIYVTDGMGQGALLQDNSRIIAINDIDGSGWISYGDTGSFRNPTGIAFDSFNRIYIADYYDDRIVRIDNLAGANPASLGSTGSSALQFVRPSGVAVDSDGWIYVKDCLNNRVVRIKDMTGAEWATIGSDGSGAYQFQFLETNGIAVDAAKNVYVTDDFNNRIVRFAFP